MPQLDIQFYVPQLFWLLVIFGSLYVLMAYIILPKLENALQAREGVLNQLKRRAQDLEVEVERLRRLNESKLKVEHDKALEQIAEYTQKWQEESAQKEFELQTLMQKRLDDLYKDLQGQHLQAFHAIKDKEKELIALVIEQLTGIAPSKQTIAKALKKIQNHETIH